MPTTQEPTVRRYATIDHAAITAGVTRRTIYNWIHAGKVRTVRTTSGRARVDLESIFQTPTQGEPQTMARTMDPREIEVGPANKEAVLEILAEGEHATWMMQRLRDKGIRTPPEEHRITLHDRERAECALGILEDLHRLGAIRFEFLIDEDETTVQIKAS